MLTDIVNGLNWPSFVYKLISLKSINAEALWCFQNSIVTLAQPMVCILGQGYLFNRPMTNKGNVWRNLFENDHCFCYSVCWQQFNFFHFLNDRKGIKKKLQEITFSAYQSTFFNSYTIVQT